MNQKAPCQTAKSTPLMRGQAFASLPIKVLWIKTRTGRGDGDAIRKSTGRDRSLPRRNQEGFHKERRKACGPARSHGKTTALRLCEARRRPRTPAGAPKDGILLSSYRSEDGQVSLLLDKHTSLLYIFIGFTPPAIPFKIRF